MKVAPGGEQGEEEKKSEEGEAPEPGSPEYFGYLTKAIFCVGLFKCITPAVLIVAGAIFLAIDVSETTQDCFEQVAGGLLIYTWGAKCMVPVQEAFADAAKTSKWGKSKAMVALMGISLTLAVILGPLFYLGTEGHDFSKVDGGIMFYGVMEKGEGVKCSDDGKPTMNVTSSKLQVTASGLVCRKPKPTRPGLVHSAHCHGDDNASGATGGSALIPYFIGFALDAIMLILVDPEEELVETYTSMRKSIKSVIKDLLVAPIAFALDNLLTGAGCCTVVMAAAGGSKGTSFIIFIVFALCTVVGVFVAFSIRGLLQVCTNNGFEAAGQWIKFAFLLAASLSFLDNGTDLVKSGLTFWVGLGCAIGWLLFSAELLDEDPEEEEEKDEEKSPGPVEVKPIDAKADGTGDELRKIAAPQAEEAPKVAP